jgi:tetratricopeptide (TPR) repeat protein
MVCIFATAALATTSIYVANADELGEAFDQYELLRDEGKYAESLVYAQKVLAIANQQVQQGQLNEDDPIIATFLNNLGTAYQRIGEPEKADDYLSQALAASERSLGDKDSATLARMTNLAVNRRMIGDLASSRELHDKAVDLSTQHLDTDDPVRSRVLLNAGRFYLRLNDFDRAEELTKASLTLEEGRRSGGNNNSQIADRLGILGMIQLFRGQLDDAAATLSKALDIYDTVPASNNLNRAAVERNLGVTYFRLGNQKKAVALLSRSFDATNAQSPPNSVEYVSQAITYARLLAMQRRCDDAIAVLQTIPFKELGDDYHGVSSKLSVLQGYAFVRLLGRHYGPAGEIMDDAIKLLDRSSHFSFPGIEPDLHFDAGCIYSFNGEADKADKHFSRCIQLFTSAYGEDSAQVAQARKNIAETKAASRMALEPDLLKSSRTLLQVALYFPMAVATDGHALFLGLYCLIMRALTKSWRWLWWLAIYLAFFAALTAMDFANPSGIVVSPTRQTPYVNLVRGSIVFVLGPLLHAALYLLYRLVSFGLRRALGNTTRTP